MSKINKEEYEVLKGLDNMWKWIARDEDRGLYAFTKKPVRKSGRTGPSYWDAGAGWSHPVLELIDEIHLFQFIQWENEEPYDIAELIEGYESEESEVKDIEWVKGKIKDFQTGENMFTAEFNAGVQDALEYVQELIDQLDEPEVLSQELPVIPKFVAEYIKEQQEKCSHWFEIVDDLGAAVATGTITRKEQQVSNFIVNNADDFVDAYRYGYTIEEKKYRVILQEELDEEGREIPMFFPEDKWYVHLDEKGKIAGTPELKNVPKFTEQEIKDYDERFWAFAVKVEELEE